MSIASISMEECKHNDGGISSNAETYTSLMVRDQLLEVLEIDQISIIFSSQSQSIEIHNLMIKILFSPEGKINEETVNAIAPTQQEAKEACMSILKDIVDDAYSLQENTKEYVWWRDSLWGSALINLIISTVGDIIILSPYSYLKKNGLI